MNNQKSAPLACKPPNRSPLTVAAVALLLAGCASGNLTGLGGSASYACAAPLGVRCTSVSGTYANATQGEAAAPPPRPSSSPATSKAPSPISTAGRTISGIAQAPQPSDVEYLRSSARILRLWVKPWEDSDQDLHDQGYVYVQIDPGRWLIDHAQRRIRDAYAPLRPPPRPAQSVGSQDGSASTPPTSRLSFPSPAGPRPVPLPAQPGTGSPSTDSTE